MTKRYVCYEVVPGLYCVWDTANDIPIEVGNAASYILTSKAHAMQWAFDVNRKDASSNWQSVAPAPEPLPPVNVLDLVGAMTVLHDYRLELVPRILARLKPTLEEYSELKADRNARDLVNEIYGNAVS